MSFCFVPINPVEYGGVVCRNPPFDSEGNRFSLESTLKDVCPTFYCESYKECNSYNTLRLEGARCFVH